MKKKSQDLMNFEKEDLIDELIQENLKGGGVLTPETPGCGGGCSGGGVRPAGCIDDRQPACVNGGSSY